MTKRIFDDLADFRASEFLKMWRDAVNKAQTSVSAVLERLDHQYSAATRWVGKTRNLLNQIESESKLSPQSFWRLYEGIQGGPLQLSRAGVTVQRDHAPGTISIAEMSVSHRCRLEIVVQIQDILNQFELNDELSFADLSTMLITAVVKHIVFRNRFNLHILFQIRLQHEFGPMPLDEPMRDLIHSYCVKDLPGDLAWHIDQFPFIADLELKKRLGRAFYSARYVSKLMEALRAAGDEIHPFIKFQIMRYASIYEAVISHLFWTRYIDHPEVGLPP